MVNTISKSEPISVMEVEHVFLDCQLLTNSSIHVNVSCLFDNFDDEYFLYLALYDARSHKIIDEAIWTAGLDERTNMLMTTLDNEYFDDSVKFGSLKVWLEPSPNYDVVLHAQNEAKESEIVLNGIGAYPPLM